MAKYVVSFNPATKEMDVKHSEEAARELNVVKVDEYSIYTVLVEAANKKHAQVVGTRLINSYMNE